MKSGSRESISMSAIVSFEHTDKHGKHHTMISDFTGACIRSTSNAWFLRVETFELSGSSSLVDV